MRLLVDTNIFLEVILEQEKTKEAQVLLASTKEHDFFITDFSLHSVGLLLFRQGQHDAFRSFLTDMLLNAGINMAAVLAENMEVVVQASQQFNLDFDDAYQYAVAEQYDLTIISFDADFDRMERGHKTPDWVAL